MGNTNGTSFDHEVDVGGSFVPCKILRGIALDAKNMPNTVLNRNLSCGRGINAEVTKKSERKTETETDNQKITFKDGDKHLLSIRGMSKEATEESCIYNFNESIADKKYPYVHISRLGSRVGVQYYRDGGDKRLMSCPGIEELKYLQKDMPEVYARLSSYCPSDM